MRKDAGTAALAGALALGLLLFSEAPALSGRGKAAELPEAVRIELLRLEETYRVLDRTAGEVWPGWTNYREFPFLFSFENGLRVLVGHPHPPEGFTLLPGLEVAGKQVWADARKIEPLPIEQPLYAGGGISSLGTVDGRPVTTIDMTLGRSRPKEDKSRTRFRTEDAILTYIHELFHCFQQGHIQVPYPNFRYNPDTTFAAYSEIEGTALERAWRAGPPEDARRYLEDFLMARRLKRKGMAEFDKLCESSDEVREGTAVYAEVRSLEVLRTGFTPRLTPVEDPYYGGFGDLDALLHKYSQRLHQRKTQTYSYFKGYEYGCYQALLLERLFPGWQAPFSQKPHFLDEELRRRIGPPSEDERPAKRRFERDYRFRYVWARHEKAVEERDAAYGLISAREGRSYVISFKPIHQFLSVLAGEGKKSYEVGLMKIFPRGVGAIGVDDIEVRLGNVPAEINQLYYLRVVDTDWQARKRAFTIQYEKKDGEDVYTKATLTTPLFELKAPQIRIVEEAKRVKIWILSRVS